MATETDVDAEIGHLAETLRGELMQPDDPEFDDERAIYNAMIDKDSRLIARCASVADVIAAVNIVVNTSGTPGSEVAVTMVRDSPSLSTSWYRGRLEPLTDASRIQKWGGWFSR